ncbi:Cyclic nucleotide-binding protein [Pseudocohnilembus persalinus]|uniref:Cyclic nucleotide-binding protein n=1 Tax=Pseudocohnilembus persalinus TaxID=266149 RepID=A0A0V0QEL6_PSEPJ|nr:Cyclic nucleotide-binding protein [Pseudocohnilembus persalinus]|eukprot:KRX00584.1 Cyclic nucleotide-binding protein [Pseudocohnilembus persalinus]
MLQDILENSNNKNNRVKKQELYHQEMINYPLKNNKEITQNKDDQNSSSFKLNKTSNSIQNILNEELLSPIQLCRNLYLKQFKKHDIMLFQGEKSNDLLYLVLKGQVSIIEHENLETVFKKEIDQENLKLKKQIKNGQMNIFEQFIKNQPEIISEKNQEYLPILKDNLEQFDIKQGQNQLNQNFRVYSERNIEFQEENQQNNGEKTNDQIKNFQKQTNLYLHQENNKQQQYFININNSNISNQNDNNKSQTFEKRPSVFINIQQQESKQYSFNSSFQNSFSSIDDVNQIINFDKHIINIQINLQQQNYPTTYYEQSSQILEMQPQCFLAIPLSKQIRGKSEDIHSNTQNSNLNEFYKPRGQSLQTINKKLQNSTHPFFITQNSEKEAIRHVNFLLSNSGRDLLEKYKKSYRLSEMCNDISLEKQLFGINLRLLPIKLREQFITISLGKKINTIKAGEMVGERIRPENDYPKLLNKVKQQTGRTVLRKINHPKYKQSNYSTAVEYLKDKENGEFVIRSSSQGPEYLTITWKFLDDCIALTKEKKNRSATCLCVEDVDCLVMGKSDYLLVQDAFKKIIYLKEYTIQKALPIIELVVNKQYKQSLFNLFKFDHITKGKILITEGEKGDKIFIFMQGQLVVQKWIDVKTDTGLKKQMIQICTIEQPSFIGEEILALENQKSIPQKQLSPKKQVYNDIPYNYTVIANSNSKVLVLQKQDLLSKFPNDVLPYLQNVNQQKEFVRQQFLTTQIKKKNNQKVEQQLIEEVFKLENDGINSYLKNSVFQKYKQLFIEHYTQNGNQNFSEMFLNPQNKSLGNIEKEILKNELTIDYLKELQEKLNQNQYKIRLLLKKTFQSQEEQNLAIKVHQLQKLYQDAKYDIANLKNFDVEKHIQSENENELQKQNNLQRQQLIFLDNARKGIMIFNCLEDLYVQMKETEAQIKQFKLDETVLGAYKFSHDSNLDFNEIINQIKKIADQKNDAWTQYTLGQLYYDGDKNIEQNYQKAFEYAKKSADQKCPSGQCLLGNIYFFGRGVEQSYEKAMEQYKLSCEQNYPNAFNMIGIMHQFGMGGLEINKQEAFNNYKISAEQGNPHGLYNIGQLYFESNQIDSAIIYLQQAADLNSIQAIEQLIKIYKFGEGGVKISQEIAGKWENYLQDFKDLYGYKKNTIKEENQEDEADESQEKQ